MLCLLEGPGLAIADVHCTRSRFGTAEIIRKFMSIGLLDTRFQG